MPEAMPVGWHGAVRRRSSPASDLSPASDVEEDDFDLEARGDCKMNNKRSEELEKWKQKKGPKPAWMKKAKITETQRREWRASLCKMLDPTESRLDVKLAATIMGRSAKSKRKVRAHGTDKDEADGAASEASTGTEDDEDMSKQSSRTALIGDVVPSASQRFRPQPFQSRKQAKSSLFQLKAVKSEVSRKQVGVKVKIEMQAEGESDEEPILLLPATTSATLAPKTEQLDSDTDEEQELQLVPSSQASGKGHSQLSLPRLPVNADESDEEDLLGKASCAMTARPGATSRPQDLGLRPAFPTSPSETKTGPLVLDEANGIEVPGSINRFLRNYQREGIRFLYQAYSNGRGCILGDDMGLGKTVQVIGFLSAIMGKTGGSQDEHRRHEAYRAGRFAPEDDADRIWPTCLIMVPKSVIGNWCSELRTWGYFEHAVLGSHDPSLIKDFRRGWYDIILSSHEYVTGHIKELQNLPWTCIFADEAHKFKNPNTYMTQAMNSFACKRRFAMSGTVVQNRYEEMWTLLDWTNPGQFGHLLVWRDLVAEPLRMGQRKSASSAELGTSRLIADLMTKHLLPPFMLRRTKKLIADQLPVKKDQIVFCPLAKEQLEAYKRLCSFPHVQLLRTLNDPCDCGQVDSDGLPYTKRNCCHQFAADEVFRIMYLMSCLANHAALFFPDTEEEYSDKEEIVRRYKQQVEYTQEIWPDDWPSLTCNVANGWRTDLCGKWLVLRDLMAKWHQQGDKVLLFSHRLRLLDWLEHFVEDAGYRHLRLDGKTPLAQRQVKVTEFNSDPNVFIFLISTNAGGTGLNLTGANKVVIFDPDWNPAQDMQAMDRAYRFGQARDVHVFRLIGAGTLEELIYGRQIYKTQVANVAYEASRERRYFDGVEGNDAHKGELFGLANLFTFRESAYLSETVIQQCDLSESAHELAEAVSEIGAIKQESKTELSSLLGERGDDGDGADEDDAHPSLSASTSRGRLTPSSSEHISSQKRKPATAPPRTSKRRAVSTHPPSSNPERAILLANGITTVQDHAEVMARSSREEHISDLAKDRELIRRRGKGRELEVGSAAEVDNASTAGQGQGQGQTEVGKKKAKVKLDEESTKLLWPPPRRSASAK